MAQSWENFFSESGGSLENDLQFGTSSMVVDVGSMVASHFLFDKMKNYEKLNYIRRARSSLSSLEGTTTFLDKDFKPVVRTTSSRVRGAGFSMVDPKASLIKNRLKNRLAKTEAVYGSLARGVRAIGLTYTFMFGAQLAESLFTPGLTASAVRSDDMAMQPDNYDSMGAYTQRQRALLAIHDSQLGIRNVIGNEAGHFHR